MGAALLVVSLVAFCSAAAAQPPVKEPHPLITEILYAVPPGAAGDAGQDGKRSATGDEFIELFNPHDKPINLKGYVLVDASREADAAGQRLSLP